MESGEGRAEELGRGNGALETSVSPVGLQHLIYPTFTVCVCVLGRGCCHSNLGCLPQCSLTPKCAQAYTGHIVGEMERETWDLSVGAPV